MDDDSQSNFLTRWMKNWLQNCVALISSRPHCLPSHNYTVRRSRRIAFESLEPIELLSATPAPVYDHVQTPVLINDSTDVASLTETLAALNLTPHDDVVQFQAEIDALIARKGTLAAMQARLEQEGDAFSVELIALLHEEAAALAAINARLGELATQQAQLSSLDQRIETRVSNQLTWNGFAQSGKGSVSSGLGTTVNALARSPDGSVVAVAGSDKFIHILDAKTGAERRKLAGHTSSIADAQWLDSNRIVTVGADKTLRITDTTTGAALRKVTLSAAGVSLAITPNGNKAYVATSTHGLLMVNLQTGAVAAVSGAPASRLQMLPDGKLLIADNARFPNYRLRLLDTTTHRVLATSASVSSVFTSFAPASNGRVAVATAAAVRFYDGLSLKPISTLNTGLSTVSGIALSPAGNVLAVADTRGFVAFFELQASGSWKKSTLTYTLSASPVDLSFGPDGTVLYLTAGRTSTGSIAALRTSATAFAPPPGLVAERAALVQRIANTESQLQVERQRHAAVAGQIAERQSALRTVQVDLEFVTVELAEVVQELPEAEAAHQSATHEWDRLEAERIAVEERAVREAALNAIAAEIAAGVDAELQAEQNAIPYARMYVTFQEQEWYTAFSVRFRNPGDATFIEVKADNGDGSGTRFSEQFEHTGGTRDATWGFSLPQRTNVWGGIVEIIQWSDPQRTKLLDRVQGLYIPYRNYAVIDTAQAPFDVLEQGRLTAEPIESDLSIIKIDGPNVIFSLQSPGDQSVVTFDTVGLLQQQSLVHAGGTTLSVSMVTFNADLQSGQYSLQLYSRLSGMVLDTVLLDWNRDTKTLSSSNAADFYAPAVDGATQAEIQSLEALLSLTSTAVDNAQLNWIQQMRLYHETANLPAPYRFFIDGNQVEPLVFQRYPNYSPANWEAGIDEVLARIGDGFTRGRAEDIFHHERLDTINSFREALTTYEQAMGQIMQKAVDVLIQIRRGSPEVNQLNALQTLIDGWNRNRDIEVLAGQLNVRIPPRHLIMDAAKLVLVRSWEQMVQMKTDVENLRAFQVRQRELGLRQTAVGEWVAVSEASVAVPPEMTRRQIDLANKIRRTLETSSDPRIAAMPDSVKDVIALGSAQLSDGENVPSSYLVAQQVVDALQTTGVQIDDDGAGLVFALLRLRRKELAANNPAIYQVSSLLRTPIDKEFVVTTKGSYFLPISLRTPTMFNATLTYNGGADLFLRRLSDETLIWPRIESLSKSGTSGESISSVLPAGNYLLEVRRDSRNDVSGGGADSGVGTGIGSNAVTAVLNVKVAAVSTSRISGFVSHEGESAVHAVSLAGFSAKRNPTTGKYEYQDVAIQPNLPAFIVIHGRKDSPESDGMRELARSLLDLGVQVLTVDWRSAADANTPPAGLQGSVFIEDVGRWVGSQLKQLHINPDQVYIVGHSWGSYVGYEIAGEIATELVRAKMIVALDPAKENIILGSKYATGNVEFAEVAQRSYAFHSSFYGDEDRALSADVAFRLVAGEGYEPEFDVPNFGGPILRWSLLRLQDVLDELVFDAMREHGFAVTAFASLIGQVRQFPETDVDEFFSMDALLMPMTANYFAESSSWEGEIAIHPYRTTEGWWKAYPLEMVFADVQSGGTLSSHADLSGEVLLPG